MDKKQRVIQAAIELFAEQGYEKTSIAAVCERANVSKGGVFHHFSNKDALMRAVFIRMAELMGEISDELEVSNRGLPPKEQLINLLENIFAGIARPDQRLYYQFDFQVLSQPRMRAVLQDLFDERYRMMMDSFTTLLETFPAANPQVDSEMLIAEIDGIALNYLFGRDDYPLAQIKDRFIEKTLSLLQQ